MLVKIDTPRIDYSFVHTSAELCEIFWYVRVQLIELLVLSGILAYYSGNPTSTCEYWRD
jgi:hypothetical protein